MKHQDRGGRPAAWSPQRVPVDKSIQDLKYIKYKPLNVCTKCKDSTHYVILRIIDNEWSPQHGAPRRARCARGHPLFT